jgi:hypothetical protein
VSLGHCISGLVADGKLTDEQARRASETYQEHLTDLRKTMGDDAAEAIASRKTVDALDFEAARRRQNTLRQVAAQSKMEDWLRRGGENWGRGDRGGNNPPPGEGPAGPINPKAARTLIARIDARRAVIANRAYATWMASSPTTTPTCSASFAIRHRWTRSAGRFRGAYRQPRRRRTGGRMVQGHRIAPATGQCGGANIGKLERWGLPQSHDSRAVAEAGFENWLAAETPRLDREKMLDRETGQPFTAAGWRRAMKAAFDSIASDGAIGKTPGAAGRSSIANQMGEHRFLIYKSYDDWKASREQFGRGTAFDAMMGHVRGMARDIAAMETLGPNPETGIRWLKDVISGDEALFEPGQLRKRDAAKAQSKAVQRLWDEYTGALTQPESRNLALAFSAYRAVATASKLGSASLTAVGDLGTGMAMRRFNGLPQAGLIRDYLKQLNPASNEDRRLAARLGFVAETWTSIVAGQHRYLAEEMTGEVSRRVAEGVLRASGMNAWTDAGRAVNGLSWLTQITNERGKVYGELEPAFRSALARYGINPEGWDRIRATPLEKEVDGSEWIKAQNVPDQELGDRILEMAHNEGDFAVPVPDLETRAYINANARRGTVLGELIRSSPLMFKTFTVSLMHRHGGRMMDQRGIGGKAGYFLTLMIPMTLMGALAVQLKEIAKGRDPAPMDPRSNPAFWGHAFVMGGGSGIVGDLAGLSAEQRYGGWEEYASGPLIADIGRTSGALVGLGKNAAADMGYDVRRNPKAAQNLFAAARQNVPGQNLFYIRLAIDRLLADQIQSHIDPNYTQSWRTMERTSHKAGQEYWWAPGETAPERAPDMANIAGAPPN